jgi:hypothetical protein
LHILLSADLPKGSNRMKIVIVRPPRLIAPLLRRIFKLKPKGK